MFDEPSEEGQADRPFDPQERAKQKFDEFRMHAEFAAVFEGPRKFGAELNTALDPETARGVQRGIAKLEKARAGETPIISPESMQDAAALLTMAADKGLSTNDYHIYRRPGEVMIVRWLEGEQVETFYTRLQAHFDAALNQFREDERQQHGWKQDEKMTRYLEALDALSVKMADRYLRDTIKQHGLFILSTQTADEVDILHLCDLVMGVPAADVVGEASAPPEDQPTEKDRAWFFKLFSLRGIIDGVERMCFFTYLQKTEEGGW